MDRERYGPWVVIAGGSEGLGASFADQLAAEGLHLVLIGRKPDPLEDTAEQARRHGGEVRALALDLTAEDLMARVHTVTDDIDVGLLICNAGANSYGGVFVDRDLDGFRGVIQVNTFSRLALAHHFGSRIAARGRGGMIFVGSMAGFRGSPYNGAYNPAKAFGRIFSEGLWYEMKDRGVDVVEFVVGGMRTPAMARRGMVFGPEVAYPDDVAREGLAHVADGPVWVSELAGGVPAAEHLNSFPREPVVEEATEGLRSIGLYP